ncbi:MAG: hypothetical protein ABJC07_07820 [Acidobacteriota bacterium]
MLSLPEKEWLGRLPHSGRPTPQYAGRLHFTQYARFYMWETPDPSLARQTS